MTTEHFHHLSKENYGSGTSTAGDPPHTHLYEEGKQVTEIADGHRHRIVWGHENAIAYCSLPDQVSYEPMLGVATTGELLDELAARNVGGQRARFENSMMQANAHIIALQRAFTVRDGGLDYRTVD